MFILFIRKGHCLISGVCYKSGENNGTNPCSICDPLLDKTVWSPNTGRFLSQTFKRIIAFNRSFFYTRTF